MEFLVFGASQLKSQEGKESINVKVKTNLMSPKLIKITKKSLINMCTIVKYNNLQLSHKLSHKFEFKKMKITCMRKVHKFKVFKFQISPCSNSPLNSFNFFLISFISIKFTKLQGDLQPTLGSLGQFLLTNIKFSNFFLL